jgi:osmotically inducible protein OsmC
MKLGSGAFEGNFSFRSRVEEDGRKDTNPEELIGAALSGCFSMMLSSLLGKEGFTPQEINSKALVHFDNSGGEYGIQRIELFTEAVVPGIDRNKFLTLAQRAASECPVSRALKVPVNLEAALRQ